MQRRRCKACQMQSGRGGAASIIDMSCEVAGGRSGRFRTSYARTDDRRVELEQAALPRDGGESWVGNFDSCCGQGQRSQGGIFGDCDCGARQRRIREMPARWCSIPFATHAHAHAHAHTIHCCVHVSMTTEPARDDIPSISVSAALLHTLRDRACRIHRHPSPVCTDSHFPS